MTARGPSHPRCGEPWSVSEDERLFSLVREYVFGPKARNHYNRWKCWQKVADDLGRTTCGVMTRHGILKAVRAHQMAAEARENP